MRKILTGFLLLSLSACLFEPNGEFYKDIEDKDYSALTVDLNTADDTLYIATLTQLFYSMQAPDFTIVGVRATLDDEYIYGSTALDNSFYLNPHDFSTGTYLLTLSLTVQSGTGSLADRFGVEHVQVWRSFVVIIDVTPPEPIAITRLDTTDGTLTIHWNPYTKWNFTSYTVVKSCSQDNYNFNDCETLEITSKETTTWADENFVGGYVRYRIDIRAGDQQTYGVNRDYKWIPKHTFAINNNKATLHWDKPKFYRNTKSVLLETPPYFPTEFHDTVYQRMHELLLGMYYEDHKVTFTSPRSDQTYKFSIPHYLGDRIDYPSAKPTLYNEKEKVYYGYTSSSWTSSAVVMNKDHSHLHWISTYSTYHFMAISPNGEHLITHQIMNEIGSLNETDPLTLELRNQNILPAHASYGELSVADNGLIACRSYNENVVYRLPDYRKVYSKLCDNKPIAISGSGNYLFNESKLYQYNGASFHEIGGLDNTGIVKVAFTREEELIVAYSNGLIDILKKEDLSVLKSIQTPLNYIFDLKYDDSSNRLLVNSNEDFYLVNIDNETSTKLPVYSYAGPVSFLQGKLFINLIGYGFSYVVMDYTLLE